MGRIAAVVLAAGAAMRFGAPKQRLLLPRVLERLAESPVDEIVVVEGAYDLCVDSTQGALRLVRCSEWERGPGASLRCGLAALGADVEAAVVIMADGPDLAPEAVARVIESWRSEGGEVVAASYDGARQSRKSRACVESSHAMPGASRFKSADQNAAVAPAAFGVAQLVPPNRFGGVGGTVTGGCGKTSVLVGPLRSGSVIPPLLGPRLL
jgi:CTP:molybdopterin cytidylyltransferase MocA